MSYTCVFANFRRLLLIAAAVSVGACGQESPPAAADTNPLSTFNLDFAVTPEEATTWARAKHENSPGLTGSPEWHGWMQDLEERFAAYGVIDMVHNSWEFERWETSDDATDWSLHVDGEPINVAFYGAYSGGTGPQGITADLVYYDHDDPPSSIEGRIVVIPTRPPPQKPFPARYRNNYTYVDYEYRTDSETYPALFEYVDPTDSYTFEIYYQLGQRLQEIAIAGHAAGLLIIYDMGFERTSGLYSFPVPARYDVPTLTLDRVQGARVIAHAQEGRSATLRLESRSETAEAYQLIGYLPGRDYGTAQDEQILMVTHTDGPSITQDNGALGILAAVRYFSNIPQENRPRTLALYLDCRHYITGMEAAFPDVTWFERHPEMKDPVVALMHMEHLGELEYKEVGEEIMPTGLAEHAVVWTRNNPVLIDAAINAVKTHQPRRTTVSVPERPGINGDRQEGWWGVASFGQGELYRGGNGWDLPMFGFGGWLGNYWTTHSGIESWDRDLFVAQAHTMTQLTGVLMTADLEQVLSEGVSDTRVVTSD
jgi:hypothetical protein